MIRTIALAAAAASVALTLAGPASAQQSSQYRQQLYGQEQMGRYGERHWNGERQWRDSNAFWPGQVAAGVVGGALGAAGAIATAPFEAGYQGNYDMRSYAERNGFVCLPGTTFRGGDGRMHLCQ